MNASSMLSLTEWQPTAMDEPCPLSYCSTLPHIIILLSLTTVSAVNMVMAPHTVVQKRKPQCFC